MSIEEFIIMLVNYYHRAQISEHLGGQFVTKNNESYFEDQKGEIIGVWSVDHVNDRECRYKAAQKIRDLGIAYIKHAPFPQWGSMAIGLSRPGLLIGKKGKNIDQLQDYCKTKILIFDTKSVETELIDMLLGGCL